MQIALAGGASAGHTSPLIATAQALKAMEPSVDIVCIGTPRGLENRVIPAAGLRLELVPPVPLPRRVTGELFAVPVRLWRAVSKARGILKRHGAQVVVGFGGYVSLPAYLAAWTLRIPVLVHEQNALPGLANRIAARFARKVLVTFPDTRIRGAEFIGLPLRREIAHLDRDARRAAARQELGLAPDLPVLLVSGGSQGARSINGALLDARDKILAAGHQILHVWGPKNIPDDAATVVHASGAKYVPVAYVDDMGQAYAAADLMLGRSGAGTVFETACVGLPTVLVPLPHGNGEQAFNAKSLVKAGGAVLVEDGQLGEIDLGDLVNGLLSDQTKLDEMSKAGSELVGRTAAETLAELTMEECR
ncbi:MAG: undecaprenyldiphospho-muramoylpentapeptide beta-N-acetylglucosaminyltransferase [Propionibacterium sp.]|nr:MAG: undecaprenyldiphospho-muramoylpentapeptide beta-N-acetylglucosaminyltransferase [Propionibacterium sp.]